MVRLATHRRCSARTCVALVGGLVGVPGSDAVMNAQTEPSIELENLTVSYRQHPALHHISGRFAGGTLTAVIGPNGAGKSTLLKTVAGLLTPDTTRGIRNSRNALRIAGGLRHVAYLAQLSELDRDFPVTVRDCVMLGAWQASGPWGSVSPAMQVRVDKALHEVGLNGFEHRPIGTLSSGQVQRALFARLMVQDAPLILLDEPFTAVDSRTAATLLALVLQWHREGRTVIAVVHDDAVVRSHFPHTLLLARECIAWGPTAEVMTEANLQRARAMAEAWDETAAICDIDGTAGGLDFETLLAQRLADATTRA